MSPLEFSQNFYVSALLIGSVVAFFGGNRIIILVMWSNLVGTIGYSHDPITLMYLDFFSALALVAWVDGKQSMTVAFIFCVMVLVYPLTDFLGFYATYSIVDGLAYVQIFAMGADGFGGVIRRFLNRNRRDHSADIYHQKTQLDAKGNGVVAMEKVQRPRVIGLRSNGRG